MGLEFLYSDLVCFIREEHSVEDLSCVVLDGVNFNKVGRVATDTGTMQKEDKLYSVILLYLCCDVHFLQQLQL